MSVWAALLSLAWIIVIVAIVASVKKLKKDPTDDLWTRLLALSIFVGILVFSITFISILPALF
jgi:hypothetical protein